MTLLGENFHLLRGLLQWLHDLFIGLLLVELLLLLHRVLLPGIRELILQLLYDVKVGVRYLLIVLLYFLVLLGVLFRKRFNRGVFLSFDHGDCLLPLLLHLLPQQQHLMLELRGYLIRYPLELRPHLSPPLVRVTGQSVQVLLMPDLLLLLLDLEAADVLLQLPLLDAVVVLPVLQLDLGLLLKLRQLVQILEHQMLDPLLVDLDLDFVLLVEVLQLPLLVPESRSLVIALLLGHDPEVIDALSFILVHPSEIFFLPNESFDLPALLPECLLVLSIINVINGLRGFSRHILDPASLLRVLLCCLLRGHPSFFLI